MNCSLIVCLCAVSVIVIKRYTYIRPHAAGVYDSSQLQRGEITCIMIIESELIVECASSIHVRGEVT